MKEKYEAIKMEIVMSENEDIITESYETPLIPINNNTDSTNNSRSFWSWLFF